MKNFEISRLVDNRLLVTWAHAEQSIPAPGPDFEVTWALRDDALVLNPGPTPSSELSFGPLPPALRKELESTPPQSILYAALTEDGKPVQGGSASAPPPRHPRRFGR